MKTLLLSTALITGFGAAAMAQDAATGTTFRAEADPSAINASDFIGSRIYASEAAVDATEYAGVQEGWQDIGEVNDVILSRDGKVEAVLVDIGGFLGIGERQVALDMSAVRFTSDTSTENDPNDWFLVVNADRATLEGAPAWTTGMADDAAMTDSATAVPAEPAATDTATAVPAEPAATDTATATADNATGTTAPAESMAATDTTAAPGVADPATNGTETARVPVARDGFTAVAANELTSEMLTGASVYDTQDVSVGTVSNLVIADDGKISEVIVDVGGFLGLGTKPVALKMDSIDILRETDGDEVRVFIPATKADLEAMPEAQI